MRKWMGEFRPPRELVSIGAARVSGPGSIEVSTSSLRVDGRVASAPPISRTALLAAGAALLLVGVVFPGADRVALPLLLLGTLGGVWLSWRSEYGVRGVHEVPWSRVEHVARLPADPEVLAIVLAGPVAGLGSPEQLYFAAANGADQLVAALREHAPAGLSMDLDSALREPPPGDEAES